MKIIAMSNNREFVQALSEWEQIEFSEAGEIAFEIYKPTTIPGFSETMYQIAADLGILTIPVSFATSLLASWVWSGLQRVDSRKFKAQITFITEEYEFQIEVSETTRSALKDILEDVMNCVNNPK